MAGLLPNTHELLHKPIEPFKFMADGGELAGDQIEAMAKLMYKIMDATKAVGLAANQIGLPYRLFTMTTGFDNYLCINPKIISYSEDTAVAREGCLSFPGVILNVTRPKEVKVEFQDAFGTVITNTFNNMLGRCFQHELDHLNGIVFTSKVSPLVKAMALKKASKHLR